MEEWIKSVSYSDLLARWEFAEPDNPFFMTFEDRQFYLIVMDRRFRELSLKESDIIHTSFKIGKYREKKHTIP